MTRILILALALAGAAILAHSLGAAVRGIA